MRILVGIDSFKGSLSSVQAGQAVTEGLKRVYEDAEVIIHPVADGGEGTVEALTEGLDGTKCKAWVTGPLGDKVEAEYGIIKGDTAIIEMAAAAGITLVSEKERNPLETTTYGVGEIIIDAMSRGCRNFVIGIGGSSTNDGGVGMLQALGYNFLDDEGEEIDHGAKGLEKLCRIESKNVLPKIKECSFNIACDVTNPLCGEFGCSRIYGPQKGADEEMIEKMDKWLMNYARLAKEINPETDMNLPGAGAAGGMGFAFVSFLNAVLKKGIDLILEETEFERYAKDSDYIITGEGRLDSQTAMGKVPVGVASIAKKYNIPVIAFAGSVTKDAIKCNTCGIDAYFPILREICTLEDAMNMENAFGNLADTAEQVFRLIKFK